MLAACLNWTDFPGSVQSSYVKEAYDMEKDGENKREYCIHNTILRHVLSLILAFTHSTFSIHI